MAISVAENTLRVGSVLLLLLSMGWCLGCSEQQSRGEKPLRRESNQSDASRPPKLDEDDPQRSESRAELDLHMKYSPIVTSSAAGWSIKQAITSVGPETIIVAPDGREFNAGQTQYPDFTAPHIWLLKVSELGSEFLVLYLPPVASGGSMMELFTVRNGSINSYAASILHHYEWNESLRAEELKNILFVDSDGDGTLELKEDDAYRWKGTITYHRFNGSSFRPLWIESYRAAEDDDYNLRLVSRRKVASE